MTSEQKCKCEMLPIGYANDNFDKTINIGIDERNGRFGEVSVKECKHCGQYWLRYFVEFEAYRASGRWYLGKIEQRDIENIDPENAVDYLEKLEWYFYGGSYFESRGKIGQGKLRTCLKISRY